MPGSRGKSRPGRLHHDARVTSAGPSVIGEESLRRLLGVRAVALTAINLSVGAGIVGLPSAISAELGGYAFLAYLLCAAVITLALLCFAEAGSRVTTSGGAYTYARLAFGPLVGGTTGIVYFLAQGSISTAAILMLLLETLGHSVPALQDRTVQSVVVVLTFGSLATLHTRWVQGGVGATLALTVAKLVPLVLVAVAVLWTGLPGTLAQGPVPAPERMGHAAVLLMFAFIGIETALCNGSEIRDPARTVPRAVLTAVGSIALLYFAIHLAVEQALGPALATAGGNALPDAARVIYGPWAQWLVGVGVLVSMAALLVGDGLSSTRVPFALGRDGVLPRALGRVHPVFRTPHVAIATYYVLTSLVALSGSFRQLAIAGVSGTLFVYLVTAVGVLRMRRLGVAQAGTPFTVPGGPVVPIAASVVVLLLLASLARAELLALAALVGIAFVVAWWSSTQAARTVSAVPEAESGLD